VSVDLVSLDPRDVTFEKDAEIRRWVEYFWARRVDTIGISGPAADVKAA
jgi:hypothetical protein